MPVLHLLRHAKSSWDEHIHDHDRPLNRRGCESASLIAADLLRAMPQLDLVLCSSARRARQTLDLVLVGFVPRPRVLIEDGLYLASPSRLIDCIGSLAGAPPEDRPDEALPREVLVIGHNPGLHELAMMLARPGTPHVTALGEGKFPTAARASFRLSGSWSALGRGRHELVAYETPRSLGGSGCLSDC